MAAIESGCIAYLTKPFSGEVPDRADREGAGRDGLDRRPSRALASLVDVLLEGLRRRSLPDRGELVEREQCVVTVSTLESTTSSEASGRLPFRLISAGIGHIGRDAGVGQAPDVGKPVGGALIDVSLTPACRYRPTGRNICSRAALSPSRLDQVDADRGLAGLEGAADGGPAHHVASRRFEADLAPIANI